MDTIGRIDKADFPELSLTDIEVKIDTGAYTSAIHSHDIKEQVIDGTTYITFQIMDPSHPEFKDDVYKTSHFKTKKIKSSSGIAEERYIVQTQIILFGKEIPIELSLSQRSDMRFPILLGRKLLKGRFIVDPSKKNLSYNLKRNNLK